MEILCFKFFAGHAATPFELLVPTLNSVKAPVNEHPKAPVEPPIARITEPGNQLTVARCGRRLRFSLCDCASPGSTSDQPRCPSSGRAKKPSAIHVRLLTAHGAFYDCDFDGGSGFVAGLGFFAVGLDTPMLISTYPNPLRN